MAVRKIVIVPTLLTLGNAVCGLASVAYASRIGKPEFSREYCLAASGWLILAAMIFDTLDGFAARLFKSAGRFGGSSTACAMPFPLERPRHFSFCNSALVGNMTSCIACWRQWPRSI